MAPRRIATGDTTIVRRVIRLASAALLILVGSCGRPGDREAPPASAPPRVSVDHLAGRDGSFVIVQGTLVAPPVGEPRLCAALAESYPPQCGGESIAVPDLDVTRIVGTSTNDSAAVGERVVWTDQPIALAGLLDRGTLVLLTEAAGAGEPSVLAYADAGPTCAAERTPPDPNCAARPVAGATIELRRPDGRRVATTTTDARGVALFLVAQGDYQVVALPVAGLPGSPARQTVVVQAGTATVSLAYDTGIR